MSRSKRFVTGLLSSYAAICVNIFYTIASVPLALHYLDKEEFGLWALVIQLSGYLMLLEFGMSGSVARSLSDHKDRIESGVYGSILRTGGRVFAIQGFFVFLLGLALARFAPALLDLPSQLHGPFTVLMTVQAALNGGKLALGSLASPLWCHQRLDLSNLAGSLGLVFSFALLWLGFHLGWHLYSLSVASAAGLVVSLGLTWSFCRRFGYYPPQAYRGRFDPKLFRELFHFGGGLFLMNLGAQLASASQVVVVSRMLGIEAAATWSIATKVFTLAQQFVGRVIDSSGGALAEMFVRQEALKLQERYRDLISISAVMAALACSGIIVLNGPFVEIWTSGKVSWEPWNNYLLACFLFSSATTRCYAGLVGIIKDLRGMRFIFLIEGVAFILFSVSLLPLIGLTGLILAAFSCNLGITGVYAFFRVAQYFELPLREVIGWIARPAGMLFLGAIVFLVIRTVSGENLGAISEFWVGVGAFCTVMVPALWIFGINRELRIKLKALFVGFTQLQ